MATSKELLDELLKGVDRPEDFFGDAGLMKELKIRLVERMLGAELTAHLGYEEGKEAPPGQDNRRNGTTTKVLKGQDGDHIGARALLPSLPKAGTLPADRGHDAGWSRNTLIIQASSHIFSRAETSRSPFPRCRSLRCTPQDREHVRPPQRLAPYRNTPRQMADLFLSACARAAIVMCWL